LAPASVDLATAAQAFHWFDKPAALAEMARIVRPGGGIALFWNVREEARSPFVADYHRLLERYGGVAEGKYLQAGRASGREATRAALELAPGWEAVRLVELRHEIAMRADDFMGMAFTASYIRALAPEDQARFGDEVTDLLQRHRSDLRRFPVDPVSGRLLAGEALGMTAQTASTDRWSRPNRRP